MARCRECESGKLLLLAGSLGYPEDKTPANLVYCDSCEGVFRLDVVKIINEQQAAEAEVNRLTKQRTKLVEYHGLLALSSRARKELGDILGIREKYAGKPEHEQCGWQPK